MGERIYASVYDGDKIIEEICIGKLNYYLDFTDMKSNLVLLDIACEKNYKNELTEQQLSDILTGLRGYQWSTAYDLCEDFKLDYSEFTRYLKAVAEDKWNLYLNEGYKKDILKESTKDKWKKQWVKDTLENHDFGGNERKVDIEKCMFTLSQG